VIDRERPGLSVVLDVNDLERATAFWSAALGFPLQRQFCVVGD
jgi:catechol 2,3-dioxygenase-like lactoylglutathione lyase family enzyme